MGQTNGREADATGVHHRHRPHDVGRIPAVARPGASLSDGPPPSPAPAGSGALGHVLPSPLRRCSWPATFDSGLLEPTGVYASTAQDYSHDIVKTLICARRLAPFYTGADDADDFAGCFAGRVAPTECPICMLTYPSPLNHTRCCAQPMCTECFVQSRRPDPFLSNPPVSPPAACPFCMTGDFGIIYAPPRALLDHVSISDPPPADASTGPAGPKQDSTDQAQRGLDTADPHVVTVDEIRPMWEAQLEAARATQTRMANRRIIMRNVDGHLVPVGVSSARVGASLVLGASARADHHGQTALPSIPRAAGPRSPDETRDGSRPRQAGERNPAAPAVDAALEEAMLMEAIRQSVLQHEEEERRRAQAQRPNTAAAAAVEAATVAHAQAVSTVENSPSTAQSTITPPLPGNGPHEPSQEGMWAVSATPAPSARHRGEADVESVHTSATPSTARSATVVASELGDTETFSSTGVDAPNEIEHSPSRHNDGAPTGPASAVTLSRRMRSRANRRSEELRPSFAKLARDWARLPVSASLGSHTAARSTGPGNSSMASGECVGATRLAQPDEDGPVFASCLPETGVAGPVDNHLGHLWESDRAGKPTVAANATTTLVSQAHPSAPDAADQHHHAKRVHLPFHAYLGRSRRA